MNKKLREFFFKNLSMRAFLHGIDKRDERSILQQFKNIELNSGGKLINKNSHDRSLMFIATGQVMSMRSNKNQTFDEGSIIGIEQFLFGKAWEDDLYCSQATTICKFRYDSLNNMANQNASAASRLFKRIMRHYCYEMVNQK